MYAIKWPPSLQWQIAISPTGYPFFSLAGIYSFNSNSICHQNILKQAPEHAHRFACIPTTNYGKFAPHMERESQGPKPGCHGWHHIIKV